MEIKLLGGLDGHERKGGNIQTGYSVFDPEGICPCLLADMGGYGIMVAEIKIIGKIDHTLDNKHESANRIYSQYGLCPTIPTCAGGNIQPKILEGEENMKDDKLVVIDIYNNKKIDGDVCGTITASGNRSSTSCGTFGIVEKEKINKVGQISSEGSQCGMVVSDDGLSPTLTAGTHGYTNPHICVRQATKKGYIECEPGGVADLSYPSSKLRRGRVQDGGKTCPSITTKDHAICRLESRYRIRKLTPRECWRLMGFSDADFDKASAVNSNTQLYKQAGNSIVVNVLMGIFSQML
jgi:DNA (cytosine-5)-methyltransferase 1